jgi:hypothetical protein
MDMTRRGRLFIIILLCAFLAAAGCSGSGRADDSAEQPGPEEHPRLQAEDLLNYDKSLVEALGGTLPDKRKVSLLVEKSQYRLTVLYDGRAVKQYPVVFGGGKGDKLMEGDNCVPEGSFTIRDLYPHQAWSKFLWIDYPTADSWAKHDQAKAEGSIPPDARIGGEVGIHGTEAGEDYLILEGINYTGGCIGMLRTDVDELYGACRAGTPVDILP